ncbi:hypothetical protein ACJA27_02210 [Mycoplasmopsis lipophila]
MNEYINQLNSYISFINDYANKLREGRDNNTGIVDQKIFHI